MRDDKRKNKLTAVSVKKHIGIFKLLPLKDEVVFQKSTSRLYTFYCLALNFPNYGSRPLLLTWVLKREFVTPLTFCF